MKAQENAKDRRPVWSARPSVSVYYGIYGAISIVLIVNLVALELWLGRHTVFGGSLFPFRLMGIPYPAEIATALIVFLAYLVEAIRLAFLRIQNKYELYEDGLYLNTGIVNLENVYVSPMAFSDARLFRTWSLRLVRRGDIIVDTNDQRHFRLQLLENPWRCRLSLEEHWVIQL